MLAIRANREANLGAMVVAQAANNVIGNRGTLPWHIPADLKRFRMLTMGKTVIMGRKTWDEIYKRLGKALPKRRNVILTSRPLPENSGAITVASLEEAIAIAKSREQTEIRIIGGAQIYKAFLPLVQTIYMTEIFHQFEGDSFFPKLNMDEWEKSDQQNFANQGLPQYAFFTLTRRN